MADIVSARFGDATNYLKILDGVVSMGGTAKRILTHRPFLEYTVLKTTTKPTLVSYGIFNGYSFPIYNSDNEELFFRMRVPYRWDGVTNPYFKMIVALAGAEDVGDKFKFQFSWNHVSVTGILTNTSTDVPVETTVTTNHSAQYSTYSVSFEIDYDVAAPSLAARDNMVGRIRRLDASANEVTAEIIILDFVTTWQVDKMFGNV
jgi:hypothetical protein